jgi:hemerythrin superfamily protein
MAAKLRAHRIDSRQEQDAIAMLIADHKKVKALFAEFHTLKDDGSGEDKSAIVEQVCNALKIHAAIEEEIFYPAVRKAIDDADLMDEALVEHASAKAIIAQLEEAEPTDELYDAKVTVLAEQIEHHVKEEESDMFPKAKKAKVDTAALGVKMLKRKETLMTELGMSPGDSAEVGAGGPNKRKSA